VLTAESGWNVFKCSEEDCPLVYQVFEFDGSAYTLYPYANISISATKDFVIDTSVGFPQTKVYIGAT